MWAACLYLRDFDLQSQIERLMLTSIEEINRLDSITRGNVLLPVGDVATRGYNVVSDQ
jgi:hypothetical protein